MMSESTSTLNTHQIDKGLNLVGLNLSEIELNQLKIGKTISLEGRSLGEIGSIFILAAALSSLKLGKINKKFTFGDLPKAVSDSASCSGIPIYCWTESSRNECCLFLTTVEGKPAIRLSDNLKS